MGVASQVAESDGLRHEPQSTANVVARGAVKGKGEGTKQALHSKFAGSCLEQ